jgi:hypothetical protein
MQNNEKTISKRAKRLHLKGLGTPRPFIFLHGFLDGRCKTAALDQESNLLNSAYLYGKRCLFAALCRQQVVRLETELAETRTEARKLLLELRALPEPTACEPSESRPARGLSSAQAERLAAERAAQTAAAVAQEKAKRVKNIRRLVELRERLATRERVCEESLAATAEALKERFAIYAHGVLLKPVRNRHIPAIQYDSLLADYQVEHNALRREIDALLQEEECDDA